jgi:hypothetical protein
MKWFAVLAVGVVAFVAAGCGGSKSPSVASIGSTPTTGASSGSASRGRAAFARCMTSHGFTAAVGSAASAGADELSVLGVVFPGKVDPASPQFQRAMAACRTFLPGGGPPALTPAQQAEHAQAMTKFAACMRKHGVPSFPDPNAQGMFTPSQLGALTPGSQLLQKAFEACQSLEPRVGPRVEFG